VIVEHTNINPNKAAHIGHIRNAVMGDTFVRCMKWLGYRVETQNYIDDTGVQVADVVVAFQHLEKKSIEEVEALTKQPKFDYHCWDVYSKMATYYAEHPESQEWRRDTLHKMEHGEGDTAKLAALIARAIVKRHIETMLRLGITYDLLPKESDIIALHFWDRAFELLKQSGAVIYEHEGKHKGCWVMKLEGSDEFAGMDEPDKILVRSNGTVTYTGKDIAYQLWKFGLLDRTFGYRRFPAPYLLWETTHDDNSDVTAPKFGGAEMVVNVIDVRQAYLQKVVKEGLSAARPQERGGAVDPLLVRDGRADADDGEERSAWRSRTRIRRAPTSRCRAAKASASKRTTSSTRSKRRPPRRCARGSRRRG
jgi:arginyl-tRNA synthetase